MITDSMPNKPVLPTALTSLAEYSIGSMRRQTGQPLGAERQGNGFPASRRKTWTATEGRATMDWRQAAEARRPR